MLLHPYLIKDAGFLDSWLLQEVRMLITPRFHRVAVLQWPFVDGGQVLADFDEELTRIGSGPRVRFDIAYAVLWQRLHPSLRLSVQEPSFHCRTVSPAWTISGSSDVTAPEA